MSEHDREYLNFESTVRKIFAFLMDLGFSEVESLPTLIRYQKDGVEVAVYHGRLSYEIGANISYLKKQYALMEIVRFVDPDAVGRYGNAVASTTEGIAMGLEELGSLMKCYGVAALKGDPQFFLALEEKRKVWVEEYWLNGLARQLRPQANDAFRRGDYVSAAELYGRIRSRLSPAEAKKLHLAEKRSRH